MTSFASLMALSATHTRQAQQAVETQLQERKRKEAQQRKLQEEKEARDREQEKKMRLKKLEEDQRELDKLRKLEVERIAKEAALQKREDEKRDSLRYGPKKAAKMGTPGSKHTSSSSDSRETTRRRRDADHSDQESGVVLTREELRQRKQQQEMRKQLHPPKRSSHPTGKACGKNGLRLPGGAINIVANHGGNGAGHFQPDFCGGSVRDRLSAMPNTLMKLNTNKRDKRTEDEIQMQVRAQRKVLEGSDATQFDDWFGSGKKKEVTKRSPAPRAQSSSPPSPPDTPASRPNGLPTASGSISASTSQKHDSRMPKPNAANKSAPNPAYKSGGATSRASSSDINASSLSHSKFSKTNKSSSGLATSHRPSSSAAMAPSRFKRPRSPSLSESMSPPPSKKRSTHDDIPDVRDTIWSLFGKNRNAYMSRDVFSDDEDMEVDATFLEREEKKSARLAREEDLRAQEDERRHEAEKRQRKKEKERAAARDR